MEKQVQFKSLGLMCKTSAKIFKIPNDLNWKFENHIISSKTMSKTPHFYHKIIMLTNLPNNNFAYLLNSLV